MSEAEALVAALTDRVDAMEPRVRPFIDTTSLIEYPGSTSGTVLVKCEHQQRTGSFKVRGAIAKLATLSDEQRRGGIVAASSGNHGLGVAYALNRLGGSGLVCVPENASTVKVAAIEALGVTVHRIGSATGETEIWARAYAEENGMVYVSPYNDLDVIAGQGGIGLEIDRQLGPEPLNIVVVAVGGGGLIAGVAAAIKARRPQTRLIGASPANDPAMMKSVIARHVVDVQARPTLSDATAGALEPGSITLPLCIALVDDWILVEEREIRIALRQVIDRTHQLIEGAAAVAMSAALSVADEAPAGQRIAVVSCGANISAATLSEALSG